MKLTLKRTRRGLLYGVVRSRRWNGDVIPADGQRATAVAMAEELSGEQAEVTL